MKFFHDCFPPSNSLYKQSPRDESDDQMACESNLGRVCVSAAFGSSRATMKQHSTLVRKSFTVFCRGSLLCPLRFTLLFVMQKIKNAHKKIRLLVLCSSAVRT